MHTPPNLNIVAGLLASIAAATGCHGCEIWAALFLHACQLKACECALHGPQAAVYDPGLGLPRAAARLLVLFEMGRCTLQVRW